jgi:hypothetical protein
MSKNNTFSLKTAIAEKRTAALLATGKFTDSGAKYSPEQATADSSNPTLRMTANTNDNGALSWSK